MKILLLLSLLALILTGCTTPIKTKLALEYNAQGMPALSYSSEKDVSYERTSTDPETGIVESVKFSANASDPATVQARANADLAAATLGAIKALGDNAQKVISPLSPNSE